MFSVFVLFWIVTANNQANKIEIDLDIVTPELEVNYQNAVFDPSSPWSKAYIRILERLEEVSDEKILKFYPGLIKLSQSKKFSTQNQQILNIVEYMTVLELISRDHLNKTYKDSKNNWETYINKDLGVEFTYRKKYWDWSNKNIINRGNLIFAPGNKKVPEDFDKKSNYELLRSFSNVYIVENDIQNDEDIADILEDIYGQWCRIFEKHPTDKEEVSRVHLDKNAVQEGVCNHYLLDIAEYNKKLNKLVLWNFYKTLPFETAVEQDLFYRANKFVEDK